MILDDHTDYHKILALGVATHIISNVVSIKLDPAVARQDSVFEKLVCDDFDTVGSHRTAMV